MVGVPNSIVLISTVNFSFGSLFPKNKSTPVINAPVSSTVNDCDRGSFPVLLLRIGGGLLTITKVFTYSSTVPSASYVVSPLLINKLPGRGSAFTELDVNLNVLSPVLNLKGGGGVVNGSLKKNEP